VLEKVKKFLVEAISNVVSIAFKFMRNGDLENKEAKEYASKNIMLNVQSIFQKIIEALRNNELLKAKVDIEKVKSALVIQIDSILKNILINLADLYPQAPPAGGTSRMREVIS
jgi:fumarylacetoacetate (FAA) hydrolase family protein